ncbi:MAG TPA: hypothetical protein VK581_08030, partial [Chthoniobacterales bacterium]|nr:hypothetical protein [Chthoniobacterales bacterium]
MLQGEGIRRGEEVSVSSLQVETPARARAVESRVQIAPSRTVTPKSPRLLTLLVLPVAISIALAIHFSVSQKEPPPETRSYTLFLCVVLGAGLVMAAAQRWWPTLRRWMRDMCPIFAAAVLLLSGWEVITSGFRLLPLPYFPSPAGVLQSLINDRALLFDSTWHSLILLLGGYALGVLTGLISGICIGWFSPARYWGMPVLKVIGPIPATAWIPLAMVVSPSAV